MLLSIIKSTNILLGYYNVFIVVCKCIANVDETETDVAYRIGIITKNGITNFISSSYPCVEDAMIEYYAVAKKYVASQCKNGQNILQSYLSGYKYIGESIDIDNNEFFLISNANDIKYDNEFVIINEDDY